MDRDQQILAFKGELDQLIERYRHEFDLTYLDAIAVLDMKKFLLQQELMRARNPAPEGNE